MDFKDYYTILGVAQDADLKDIKTAYRRLARKYHPDVSEQHDAEKHFKEVAEAYEVLSDEKKRAEYDQLRQVGGGGRSFEPPPGWQSQAGGDHGDFSEFFENLFGSGRFRAQGKPFGGSEDFSSRRGRDLEVELPLFLEETFADAPRPVHYKMPHYGEGGRLPDVEKTLNVTLPVGVADGERIRLKGQGAPGFGTGPAGDLYLKIRLIPHPLFDVSGHDLTLVVPLAPWEAALGTKLTIPTLTGKISLSVRPNSQSGQRLRIKGKGLRSRDGSGDLYAVLKVVMPPSHTDAAAALWKQLATAQPFNPRHEWEA